MNEDVEKLRVAARALRDGLEHYARVDKTAHTLLKGMTPLLDKIERGEVVPPQKDHFHWYLGSTDSPLMKYDDLIEAGAKYAKVLEKWDVKMPGDDWASSEAYGDAGIAKHAMQKAARLLRCRLDDYAKTDGTLQVASDAMTPWFDTINGINKLMARVVDNKLEYYVDPETEAHAVLRAMAPWFNKPAAPGSSLSPQEGTFMWYLRSAESPLSKHDDLGQLRRECATAIEDWFFKARWNGWESAEAWQAAQLAARKDGNEE